MGFMFRFFFLFSCCVYFFFLSPWTKARVNQFSATVGCRASRDLGDVSSLGLDELCEPASLIFIAHTPLAESVPAL